MQPAAQSPVQQQQQKQQQPEPPRRTVVVDTEQVTWYMLEPKPLPEQARQAPSGIFLDVDGVLHPLGVGADDPESFCHLPRLLEILTATGSSVVLSSSWRLDAEGIQELNDRLGEATCKESTRAKIKLLDIIPKPLPPLNELGNRDKDIQRWLEMHAAEIGWGDRWVALDDLDLRASLGDRHTVVTDGEVGLTAEKVTEALEKLSGKDWR